VYPLDREMPYAAGGEDHEGRILGAVGEGLPGQQPVPAAVDDPAGRNGRDHVTGRGAPKGTPLGARHRQLGEQIRILSRLMFDLEGDGRPVVAADACLQSGSSIGRGSDL
jgi:hypothetical protein